MAQLKLWNRFSRWFTLADDRDDISRRLSEIEERLKLLEAVLEADAKSDEPDRHGSEWSVLG